VVGQVFAALIGRPARLQITVAKTLYWWTVPVGVKAGGGVFSCKPGFG